MATTKRRRSSARRVARVALVVAGLAVIALGALWLVDWLTPRTTAEQTLTLAPAASSLTIEVGSGDVTLTHADGAELQVRRTSTYGWRQPEIEERADGSGAVIKANCPSLFGLGCNVSYGIAVPRGFGIDLAASSGDIQVRGVTAERLHAEVSSGRIELVDVTGPVELRASSGSINGTRLSSTTVVADVSSGSTTVDFVTPPSDVKVSASSGDVTLRLPTKDGPYRVKVDTSSGDKQVDVPTDSRSPRAVTVEVSSGNVAVLPR